MKSNVKKYLSQCKSLAVVGLTRNIFGNHSICAYDVVYTTSYTDQSKNKK